MSAPITSAARTRLNDTLTGLAHPIRLALLVALADSDGLDVGTLAAIIGIPVANTSHHLARLRDAGIIRSERAGTRIVNRLDPQLFEALDQLATLLPRAHNHAAIP